MKNRAVRIALLLLVVAAFGGTGYEMMLLEGQATAARESGRAFDGRARQVDAAVRELRASQFAYVATGQGSEFWMTRAATLLTGIGADLQALCRSIAGQDTAPASNGPAAKATANCPALSPALEDLATVQRIDTSVRAYLKDDQRLLASDLVFTDLREATQSLMTHVAEARSEQSAVAEAATDIARKREAATAAGAALFALIVLLLLVGRTGTVAPTDADALLTAEPEARSSTLLARGKSVEPPSAKAEPAAAAHGAAPAKTTAGPERAGFAFDEVETNSTPWPGPPAPANQRALKRDAAGTNPGTPARQSPREMDLLAAAAGLCTDFARLHETSELPALLERTALMLGAAGIVIWVDDAASGELRPALSHGYPPQVLTRMQGMKKDADNATASAYRDRTLRVVEADGTGNGALVVPLLAPDACVGVMAAEFRGSGERETAVQAVATILAAQIATLVSPAPAGTNEGAGAQ